MKSMLSELFSLYMLLYCYYINVYEQEMANDWQNDTLARQRGTYSKVMRYYVLSRHRVKRSGQGVIFSAPITYAPRVQ